MLTLLTQLPIPPVPETGSLDRWIITALIAVVLTLCGALVFLARYIEGKWNKQLADMQISHAAAMATLTQKVAELEKHVEDCEDSKEKYLIQVASLQAELSLLKYHFMVESDARPST